jgi:hypothetical protein
MQALLCASALVMRLQVVEQPDVWQRMVGATSAPTDSSRAWASLIRSRVTHWESEIPALSIYYAPVEGPEIATIVIGHGGGEDAFTHDPKTIAFDAVRLHKEYGDASLPENEARIDRFFRHEYTHLLQKAWLAKHPYNANTPMREALLGIWTEGLGNYHSLSQRWRSPELVSKTLAELEPRFVARLSALACADRASADALMADLSMGRFDQKWGALPAALWLDANGLRTFVLAGPDGVWDLADKHVSETSRAVLREARKAEELCAKLRTP